MQTKHLILAIAAPALLAALAGCIKENSVDLTINEDGTAKLVNTIVVDRAVMERQMALMREYEDREAQPEEDEEEPGEPPAKAPPKPEAPAAAPPAKEPAAKEPDQAAKDAELAAKVRQLVEQDSPFASSEEADVSVDAVEITKDTVRIVMSMRFKDLEGLVAGGWQAWEVFGYRRLSLDKDDAGKLRLTLASPGRGDVPFRRIQEARAAAAAAGFKGRLSFTFPGKVLSSPLPETEDARTAIHVDAARPESLDAMEKLYAKPLVIVAEPGKLAMTDFPLDSARLRMSPWEQRPEYADVPVTDAAAGYVVEPMGAVTTLVHVFPEARKHLGDRVDRFLEEATSGCEVRARLYAPMARGIISVAGVRLLRAVDDQGREIKAAGAEGEGEISYERMYGSDRPTNTADITVRMAPPAPGAEAIDELQGEVIVTTFSGYKEHPVADPQADPANEIDLGALVPGAKMFITKVRPAAAEGRSDGTIGVKVVGPRSVSRVDFQVRIEGAAEARSYGHGSSTRHKGQQVIRTLDLSYGIGRSPMPEGAKLVLVARVPDDVKRERVKFLMRGIDLF